MEFFSYFAHCYVINLPERRDRLRQFERELRLAGSPELTIFPAVRPDEPSGFPSIGARGCFLSHLAVLKDAHLRGHARLLICEDDLSFVPRFEDESLRAIDNLQKLDWRILYAGHGASGLKVLDALQAIVGAHCMGFDGRVVASLINFLDAILSRQPGDPSGGPMHVDGAYNWFRAANPDYISAAVRLGYQRHSRSDIASNAWFDKVPIVRAAASMARRVMP